MQSSTILPLQPKLLQAKNSTNKYKDILVISQSDKTFLIPVTSIMFLQAQGSYCKIYTKSKSILSSNTLKYMVTLLNPKSFLRVHHSFCVNTTEIREIHKRKPEVICLSDGSTIPISRTYKRHLITYLNALAY